MRTAKGTRSYLAHLPVLSGLGVLLLLAVVVGTTAVSGRLQASTKADFTLSASPTNVTVQQGQTSSYTINEAKLNGFNDPVGLAVTSGLPSGATASFSPQTLSAKSTSVLTIAGAMQGTYNAIVVTGSSGSLSHAVQVSLVVKAAPAADFSVSASPASQSMLSGDTASFAISTAVVSGSFTSPATFSVTGAPAAATSTFNPTSAAVGGPSTTLNVATKSNTAAGSYTLTITGSSGSVMRSTTVTLVISTSGKPFTITSPTGVVVPGPGASVPLDLSITNPNNQPMQVTNLTVTITGVVKAASAPANRTCSTGDYSVVQLSGSSYPFTVGAGETRKLSEVGITTGQPRLSMLNSSSNQDGCKSAIVNLSFSGAGQGS